MVWHLSGWCMVKPSVPEPMRLWLKTSSISHWEKKNSKFKQKSRQMKRHFNCYHWTNDALFPIWLQGTNFSRVWITIFHPMKSKLLSAKWQQFYSALHVFTHKQLEIYESVINIVATYVLVLKHQAISINSAEYIYIHSIAVLHLEGSKRQFWPIFDWVAPSHLGKGHQMPLKNLHLYQIQYKQPIYQTKLSHWYWKGDLGQLVPPPPTLSKSLMQRCIRHQEIHRSSVLDQCKQWRTHENPYCAGPPVR